MNLFFEKDEFEVQDAKWLAQFIAFSPFVFQICYALQKFGIFAELEANSAGTAFADLQKTSKLSDYSLSVLLDAAESSKVLKKKNDLYFQTQVGHFLHSDAITKVNFNFTKDVCYTGLDQLALSLSQQKPEGLKHFGNWNTLYEGLTQLPEPVKKSWFDFDHFYSDESFPRVLPILFKNNPKRILDIGSNTGKFAKLCLQYNNEVQVTLVDHPQQLQLAKERLASEGLLDRAQFFPTDLLKHDVELPKDHDVIWMSQFLDCFPDADIVEILKRCRRSMNAQSQLFIMETFTDRQKFSTAKFCLDMTSLYFTCLANGNSRMYRATDFYDFIKKAELVLKEEQNHIRLSHTLLKCMLS